MENCLVCKNINFVENIKTNEELNSEYGDTNILSSRKGTCRRICQGSSDDILFPKKLDTNLFLSPRWKHQWMQENQRRTNYLLLCYAATTSGQVDWPPR